MKQIRNTLLALQLVFFFNCSEAHTKKDKALTNETPEASNVTIDNFDVNKVTDNLYVLKSHNYNTNIGVYIGNKEIVLIDPMAGNNRHDELVAALKTLSPLPVSYVINTHSHFDHSGANSYFADKGATIVSHENTVYSNAKYDVTFKDNYTLKIDEETIEMKHVKGHSIDDILVVFKKSNVLFMGDNYLSNQFPNFYFGGGGEGLIKTLNTAMEIANDQTTIIPGHGPLGANKASLATYIDNVSKWIGQIKTLNRNGQSINAICNDAEITSLSRFFNKRDVDQNWVTNAVGKVIASESVETVPVRKEDLVHYNGSYSLEDGNSFKAVALNDKMYFNQNGYMFELLPVSDRKFYIRGMMPQQYIEFDKASGAITHFDGKANQKGNKLSY